MEKTDFDEYVYAGPVFGYAQIALAYVAKIYKRKATVFLETKRPMTKLTQAAKNLGANIVEVGHRALLKEVEKAAENYVENAKKQGKSIYLVPFGLYTEEYVDLLADQIKKAMPDNVHPKRIWLVVGSGTVLNALYKVFPKTFFIYRHIF